MGDPSVSMRKRQIIIVTPDTDKLQLTTDPECVKAEEQFPEEDAVCRSCFGKFETQNMFMEKCNCPKARLIHEECKSTMEGNNKCNVCEQQGVIFAVKWSSEEEVESSTKIVKTKLGPPKRGSIMNALMKQLRKMVSLEKLHNSDTQTDETK